MHACTAHVCGVASLWMHSTCVWRSDCVHAKHMCVWDECVHTQHMYVEE